MSWSQTQKKMIHELNETVFSKDPINKTSEFVSEATDVLKRLPNLPSIWTKLMM